MKLKENSQRENFLREESVYTFSDEATREKIEKHLHDPNDVITEDDIRKVKIPGTEPENRENLIVKPKRKNKKAGKPIDENVEVTPWDIIKDWYLSINPKIYTYR